MLNRYSTIMVIILLSSCSEYANYQFNNGLFENGYSEKSIGDKLIQVEIINENNELNHFQKQFLISFSYLSDHKSLYQDVSFEANSESEHMNLLYFGLDDYISLQYDEKKYKPSIMHVENAENIRGGINIVALFTSDEIGYEKESPSQFKLVIEDPLFNTGRTEFH